MSVYDRITALVVEQLERGTPPWRRPWGGQFQWPRNLTTLRPYRGVNVFLLASAGYASPLWMTYRQAQELGGHVRKGERGMPIVFWTKWEREDKETGEQRESTVLRNYVVFNATQIDGIERLVPAPEVFANQHEPIAECECIVAGMPQAPAIRCQYDRAFYRPADDVVGMPPIGRFDSPEAYHSTLFHELAHSTGHKSRLARPGIVDAVHFGSESYGMEELVAEMTAAFLCGTAGIETAVLPNAAAYIGGWLAAIRKDVRMVVHAGAAAQRAADYILNASN